MRTTRLLVHPLPGLRLGRLARRLGPGQPGGEVSGQRGQLGAVRAANVWPARRSSSSLVSLPCANAAVSVSITCSRSASEAMRRPGG